LSIPVDLLLAYGASYKKVKKRQVIFYEGDPAIYYYQIIHGKVKMINGMEEENEFIQGIFEGEQCFGEPPLFYHGNYPATAIANEPTLLIRLAMEPFRVMLKEHTFLMEHFLRLFAERLRNKSLNAVFLTSNNTEKRIYNVLETYARPDGKNVGKVVRLTRQDVADLCGLRVETVIRAIKKMEGDGHLKILYGKVFIP
jgi:CRP/FNR family cyclic AMP-dependent transcriptional regulator